jgi:hypothetical protein
MLIFLDIDGVMVPAAGWKAPELLEDGFPMFTQKAIISLRSLLSVETRIILSTSHRDRFSIDKWKEIFAKRGLHIGNLDRLPSSSHRKRKEEILHWFSSHERPVNFLIIDDDKSLYDLPRELKDHLVMTSSLIGLTPEKLDEVLLSLLNVKHL